jgi:hypothetical protein
MSNDGTGLGGVVSHRGELFSRHREDLRKGIFCLDGSAVPMSLGKSVFSRMNDPDAWNLTTY